MGWMEITTAANTTTLVAQGRRRELVEQGRIGVDATPADVRAAEKTIRREAKAANQQRIADHEARMAAQQARLAEQTAANRPAWEATADPLPALRIGLLWIAAWTVVLVVALVADSSFWTVVAGLGLAGAVAITLFTTTTEMRARSRHRSRQVS